MAPFDTLTGYELRHLPRHLAEAGRDADLHRLLGLEYEPDDPARGDRPQLAGRSVNAWYAAVTRDGDVRGYLQHVEIATAAAERATRAALRTGPPATELALEFHYALSAASVRNVAANASMRLLSTMVRRGLLSTDEALAHVRQVPDPRDRAEGLTTLLVMVDGEEAVDVAGEALAAVSAVQDEFWRVGELGRLFPHLPPWMSPEAELIAEAISDVYYRVVALSIVGREIDGELRSRVGTLHFHRKNIMATEYDLAEVVPSFRTEFAQRRTQAVAALADLLRAGTPERISSPYWLTETYATLADESDEYLRSAMAVAGRVGAGGAQDALTRAAALRLAEAGRGSAAQALVAEHVADPTDRLLLRCDLAARAGGGASADEVARVPDPWDRLRAFAALLPALDAGERASAVRTAVAGEADDPLLAERLVAVTSYLDAAGWEVAVRAAEGLTDDEQRMRVCGTLAARGVRLGRTGALALLDRIDDEFWYARALDDIVVELVRRGAPDEGLRLAVRAPYPHRRVGLIAACAVALSGTAREDALAEARAAVPDVTAPTARARALVVLAGALHDPDRADALQEAAEAALAIEKGNEPLRSAAVAAVVDSLAAAGRIDRSLDLADEITDEHWLATALAAVAGHAATGQLPGVLATGRSVRARRERARVLAAVGYRQARLGSDPVVLHDSWREVLQTLALGGRDEFLRDAAGLLPVAEALGGTDVLVEVVQAVSRVMRWWP